MVYNLAWCDFREKKGQTDLGRMFIKLSLELHVTDMNNRYDFNDINTIINPI